MNKTKQLKLQYQNDIKRSFLPSTFDELLKNIISCFKLDSKPQDSIAIFYKDDEDDKVRISNQFDLEQALIFYEKQSLTSIKLFIEIDKEIANFNEDLSKIDHVD